MSKRILIVEDDQDLGGLVARRMISAGFDARHVTDGAAAGTWRGETSALGRHGGNLAVGLARTLFRSVPMG